MKPSDCGSNSDMTFVSFVLFVFLVSCVPCVSLVLFVPCVLFVVTCPPRRDNTGRQQATTTTGVLASPGQPSGLVPE